MLSLPKYQLSERTAKFGEEVISVCQSVNKDVISHLLIKQAVRAATHVGAKYAEAQKIESHKLLKKKLYACWQEAQTAQHWLRMLKKSHPKKGRKIEKLRKECYRFELIFQKLIADLNKEEVHAKAKSQQNMVPPFIENKQKARAAAITNPLNGLKKKKLVLKY